MAWRELVANVNDSTFFGQDGVRDPDAPCTAFHNGKPAGLCETDGHYLCDECMERASCSGCGRRPMSCECDFDFDEHYNATLRGAHHAEDTQAR
jgi:hypothetical protein